MPRRGLPGAYGRAGRYLAARKALIESAMPRGGELPPVRAGDLHGVLCVAHVRAFDEDLGNCGQVQPGEVVAGLDAARAG